MQHTYPLVGIGVMVLKDDQVLLGKRKGAHGEGEYAFPGGHLEYMESFESCARREIAEECGIEIGDISFQFLANITTYAPKHYVHIGVITSWKSGEPEVKEPDKVESWGWYDIKKLPEPLFEPCALALKSYMENILFFDT